MAIKDTLGKAFGEAKVFAKGAVDSSKKQIEKTKIKGTITQYEGKLNDVYVEIGKKFEEVYSPENAPEFTELFTEIGEIKAKIAAAKAELAAVDCASFCPNCGETVLDSQAFCSKCGAKQEKPVVAEPEVQETEVVEAEVVEEPTAAE